MSIMDLFNGLNINCVICVFISIIYITECRDSRENCPQTVRHSKEYVATYKNNCYLFVNREKYWDEAKHSCAKMGGEMLYIKDSDTMRFIKRTLNSGELGWDNNGVWNGASDLRKNDWEWTTGEKLTYTYWDEGEPSKLLGFLSFENCCCMRRSHGWRWHDYHCHMNGLEYNYICQFPFVNRETEIVHQTQSGTTMEVRDDTVAIIGLIVGGVLLLVILCAISCILYKKHERQKMRVEHPSVIRFQNTGYATIIQDVSHNSDNQSADVTQPTRPISNIYFDPTEVNRIYEEVNKDTDHGVNSLSGPTTGVTRLVYTGGATEPEDADGGYLSCTVSEASAATSGYCSSTTEPKTGDSEYVEMNGAKVAGNENLKLSGANGVGGVGVSENNDTKNGMGGYKNCVQVKPTNSNVYVTPCSVKNSCEGKINNDVAFSKDKPNNTEMHIYTNQLDSLDTAASLRPLPPIPACGEKTPLV